MQHDDAYNEAVQAVGQVRHLARLPQTAGNVIQRAQDPDCLPDDLAKEFSNDPVLGSQLLKVANSAFYGLRSQVSSISHASNLLGCIKLRNIALASSLGPMLHRESVHPSFSLGRLWDHSIATAAAARQVAVEARRADPEEAFAAGLIHDLGLVVVVQDRRSRFSDLLGQLATLGGGLGTTQAHELENAVLGSNHQLFGAALCESWGFPKRLSAATAWHHAPLDAPEDDRDLAAVVHLADAWTGGSDHGLSADLDEHELDAAALAHLGLDPAAVGGIRERIETGVAEARSAFA